MRRLGRHSTAELYHAAGAHFRRFLGGDRPLTSITATMVDDFLGYLRGLRLRVNTINSYLSGLRAVYNAACRERGIARTVHPFAHLRLRREATAKRAIPVRAIERMAATDWSDSPDLQRAADLALFSFLAQGMPLADILALRKSDIRGNVLTYYRRKTGTRIQLRVSPGMRGLLRKYRAPSAYLFPFGSDPDRRGAYKILLVVPQPGLAGDWASPAYRPAGHLLCDASFVGFRGVAPVYPRGVYPPGDGALFRAGHPRLPALVGCIRAR